MKKNATNSTSMKLNNRQLILNIIRKKPISRADLARLTGLTRAAVTLIVDELIREGILEEVGIAESSMGRKPILLDLNIHNHFAIGLYISREECYVSISNIKAELIIKRKVLLEPFENATESMNKIIGAIESLIYESKLTYESFIGIGVVTPGPVDINAGIILNPPNFDKWHNFNIVRKLQEHFKLPAYLENYSTSLALIEKNYGRGIDFENFMLMVVNEGIGAGIIMKDQLYRGVGGFGHEVGHTTINFSGPKCSCGNRGCLEVYASIPSVLKTFDKKGIALSSWKEVVDKALDGDEICKKVIEYEAYYLAAGITNVTNMLELEAVILTGDIIYKPELLLNLIRQNVENTVINRYFRKLPIMCSSITCDVEVKAAAAVIIEKFFEWSNKE
ncbi:MAG TPA: ROK family transcriptional regulator [Clostridiaceae bacterium]|nr:ROK family transcriptional regulator [Clostridiaceae bacterium]